MWCLFYASVLKFHSNLSVCGMFSSIVLGLSVEIYFLQIFLNYFLHDLSSTQPHVFTFLNETFYSNVDNLIIDKVIISHSNFLLVYFWVYRGWNVQYCISQTLCKPVFLMQCRLSLRLPLLASMGTEAFYLVTTLADTLVFGHWLCEGQEAGCSPPILLQWMVAGTAGFETVAIAVTPWSWQ